MEGEQSSLPIQSRESDPYDCPEIETLHKALGVIDRISPTVRPNGRAVGFQSWRSLLFMHWAIPVSELRPLVPSSLELDLYDGVAYVGVVPFSMRGVRPRWAPSSVGFDFLETNVRTYVTHAGRPGVYFFSLDAASRIAVWVARQLWGLPYFHSKMSLMRKANTIEYRSQRSTSGLSHHVTCRLGERLEASRPESLEFFFLERYLLFLERRGKIYTGQVHHAPYPIQLAQVLDLEDDLLVAAGCGCCDGVPEYVHFSTGVDVEIFDLRCN